MKPQILNAGLTEVLSIDRAAKTVKVVEYATKKEYTEPYDDLVLSGSF